MTPRISGRLGLHIGRRVALQQKGAGDCGASPSFISNLADRWNLDSAEADEVQRWSDALIAARNKWSIDAGHRNALARGEGKGVRRG